MKKKRNPELRTGLAHKRKLEEVKKFFQVKKHFFFLFKQFKAALNSVRCLIKSNKVTKKNNIFFGANSNLEISNLKKKKQIKAEVLNFIK